MVKKSWFTGILIESTWANGPTDPFERHKFYGAAQRALLKISEYDIGKDLLNLISKRHEGIGTSEKGDKRVVIIRPQMAVKEGGATAAWTLRDRLNKQKKIGDREVFFAGKGSKTVIYIHLNETSDAMYTRLAGCLTPSWIALAHELIHAWHHLGGNQYAEEINVSGTGIKREELWTTGIGPYANTRISENALRQEAGLPLRAHYYFPDDVSHVKANAPVIDSGALMGYWKCHVLKQAMER
jgi:hypothetical protein